jgi:uncharacterized protein (TIGR01777 family)
MQIAIAGASGLIGSALVRALGDRGHSIRRLVRSGGELEPGCFAWNPAAGEIDGAAIEGADAVINLAGANIAGARWTKARRRSLRDSRVFSTNLISRAIVESHDRPTVLLNASAIGYYGTHPEGWVDESSPVGGGFLAGLCSEWEGATEPAAAAGVRVARLRFGVVIARQGGALAKLLPVFRLGLGGPIAGGQMWMSWISIADLIRVVEQALADPRIAGGVNVVAPLPATNAELTRELSRALRRPAILPVPAWALRLALGRMADETLLASARARAGVLQSAGFTFRHESIGAAIDAALHRAS